MSPQDGYSSDMTDHDPLAGDLPSEIQEAIDALAGLELTIESDVRAAHVRAAAESVTLAPTVALVRTERTLVQGIAQNNLARAAAAAIVFIVSVSGLAAADALPEPAQNAVASVASVLGIDLPDGDGGDEAVLEEDDADERNDADESSDHTTPNEDASVGGADEDGADASEDDESDDSDDDSSDDHESDDSDDSDDDSSEDDESDDSDDSSDDDESDDSDDSSDDEESDSDDGDDEGDD